MKNEQRSDYVTRDTILSFLSDAEVARVSTAETAPSLVDGEEYIDLEHLDRGVRKAPDAAVSMGRVLPRRSVHEDTWSKIVMRLGASSAPATPADAKRS